MATCFLSDKIAKKSVRRISVRNDLVDATCYLSESLPESLPVFVSVSLIQRLKRLGADDGINKLRQVVNHGMCVAKHNRNRVGNFIIDGIPREFYAVQRYYGGEQPGLVIDCLTL
jgi:hypothetical protein